MLFGKEGWSHVLLILSRRVNPAFLGVHTTNNLSDIRSLATPFLLAFAQENMKQKIQKLLVRTRAFNETIIRYSFLSFFQQKKLYRKKPVSSSAAASFRLIGGHTGDNTKKIRSPSVVETGFGFRGRRRNVQQRTDHY